MKPAINPIRRVSGVPETITANRSRPWRSEPNHSVEEGGWSGRTEIARAFDMSATNDPTTTNASRMPSSTSPAISVGLRRRYRPVASIASSQALRSRTAAGTAPCCAATAILGPPVRDPRVDQRVDDVEDQQRQAERDDRAEDDPLDEEVVGRTDRLIERVADPGEGEDGLHQNGAGYQTAERNRQAGRLREDRVAHRVAQENRRPFEPLRLGEDRVILALGGHHHAAHPERPAADVHQDDRQRRQNGVLEHVEDERRGEA